MSGRTWFVICFWLTLPLHVLCACSVQASKMALDKKLRVKELRKTKSVKAFKSKNRYKRK